jgi:hypothetical protein
VSAPQHPGQAPWPERPAPIQFRAEPQPQQPDNPVLIWTLRGLGLLAVAVISGLVWWYIHEDAQPAASQGSGQTTRQSTGMYQFTAHEKVPKPLSVSSCPGHAYGDVDTFFKQHPCERLIRGLYVAKVSDGRTVYTSVSVVRMPDADAAARLRQLTDADKTGNVNDLVREGQVTIDGLSSLSRGYASTQWDREIVIVESAFGPKEKKNEAKADKQLLDEICADALRLAAEMANGG